MTPKVSGLGNWMVVPACKEEIKEPQHIAGLAGRTDDQRMTVRTESIHVESVIHMGHAKLKTSYEVKAKDKIWC